MFFPVFPHISTLKFQAFAPPRLHKRARLWTPTETHACMHIMHTLSELKRPLAPFFVCFFFYTPALQHSQGVVQSNAVCSAQPATITTRSQKAWCGWLWLCLLSPPDHHMMNHVPALSKTTHTHSCLHGDTSSPALHSSQQPRQENLPPSPSPCMEINFNKPSQSSQQQYREQEKQKIHQGAWGRREKALLQPAAVRAFLLLKL